MNIALIGFRGAGKTTVGKLLARKLDKKFISLDEEIEKRTKTKIDKLIKNHGWDRFREIESQVTEDVCDFDDCIFDTGGGVVVRNENVVNLKKNSLVIFLTADLKTMSSRLKSDKKRPALTENKSHIDEIREVMDEREPRYRKAADYTIDTSGLTPEEICDLITHYIEMEMQ